MRGHRKGGKVNTDKESGRHRKGEKERIMN